MSLKVYRIDLSLVGKVFGLLRKTDLPPIVGAGAACGSLFRSVNDLMNYDNHYVIKNKDELSRFINPLGNSWVEREQYYIRHPKIGRDRWLIESDKYPEFIYREQISEIVSFLRSSFEMKKLEINILNGIDFSVFAKVPIQELNLEGKASVRIKTNKQMIIDCPEGLKISERRKDYVWLNDFPDLLAVADGFSGGIFQHTITQNNSISLGVKEVKLLGVDASWLSEQVFEIKFVSN